MNLINFIILQYRLMIFFQELEEEEDTLNREFGAVCADISSLQESADNISHEIISLTALLETASGTCNFCHNLYYFNSCNSLKYPLSRLRLC